MSDEPLSERMREFQNEVDALKVGGGKANPERTLVKLGVVGMVAGIVIAIGAWFGSHSATDALEQQDYMVGAIIGLTIAVVGTGLFAVATLTRYFRYWLIRLVYQDRESTDRIIEATKR